MNIDICNKCPLNQDGLYKLGVRKNICGNPRYIKNDGMAKVLLQAESFGANEDIVNLPLVGRSGKLLDELIKQSGLGQFDLKLDNTVKCRPIKIENKNYKNRTPTDEEINYCFSHYSSETLDFNPDLIIMLGRTPFKAFFPDLNPSDYRGKGIIYNYNNKEIMSILTYHPAACLYNPANKPILLRHLNNAALYLQGLK